MKRSNHILQLALNDSLLTHNKLPLSVEEQMESLHSEHISRTGSPLIVSQMEISRESPLTHEQQMVIVEMENLGFIGNDYLNGREENNNKDLPLYTNKSPLSIFTSTKDLELDESNITSVDNEQQLTPLFTPIPSVKPLKSPDITSNINLNTSTQIFLDYDSDDSVADPNYLPHKDGDEPSPISLTASSLTQTHLSICDNNIQQIEAPSLVDSNIDREETIMPLLRRNKRKVPENWKKNIRIRKRNSGEEYISAKGKNKEARRCSKENCKCQRACHTKIDTVTRQRLFDSFWALGNLDRQRHFLAGNVISNETIGSRVVHSRRKFTLSYGFNVDLERISVCQPFFLSTLDVSDKMVRTALKKARRRVGHIPSPDKRGRHTPSNKFNDENIKFANDHIDLFPAVPSHWCRRDTKKIYLESTLNKEKMYNLYKQYCLDINTNPIGKTSYKELILKKNIDFHKPRKDQCWCHKYEQLNEIEQKEKQEEYEEHICRKDFAKEEKIQDKIKATTDSTLHVCTFDFQAVLFCPLVLGKPVFYKRKLGNMNFTIHNAVTKQGYCYFWPEYEGNRGANEVSTCLRRYIRNLTDVDHLVLYSDCCPGQNRNSVLATMLTSIIMSPNNKIKVIDYKFLEPGHTYMECDNMHSTIERASEFAKIYTPDDWQNVIRLARKDNPYKLQVMNHTDFLDFKTMRDVYIPNPLKASDGTVLPWAKIRWLRLKKDVPDFLYIKCDYWEDFKEVKLKGRVTRSEHSHSVLKSLYSEQILLKQIKYKDLMAMCKDGTIPKIYHNFYKNLPVFVNSSASVSNVDVDNDDELTLSVTRASYLRRRPKKKN